MRRPKFYRFRRDIRDLKSNITKKEDIILRDFLAMERTTLANERTLLSTLRSSIYMTLAGIAFLNLEEFSDLSWIGYALFVISIGLLIYGIYRYRVLKNKLAKHYKHLNSQEKKTQQPEKPE